MCVQALSYKGDSPPKAHNYQWNAFWLSTVHHDKSSLHVSNDFVPVPHLLGDFVVQTYQYACRAYHIKR